MEIQTDKDWYYHSLDSVTPTANTNNYLTYDAGTGKIEYATASAMITNGPGGTGGGGSTWTLRDDDDDDFAIDDGKYVKVMVQSGPVAAGTDIAGAGTTGDPWVLTISAPNNNTTTFYKYVNVVNAADAIQTTLTATSQDYLNFKPGTAITMSAVSNTPIYDTVEISTKPLTTVINNSAKVTLPDIWTDYEHAIPDYYLGPSNNEWSIKWFSPANTATGNPPANYLPSAWYTTDYTTGHPQVIQSGHHIYRDCKVIGFNAWVKPRLYNGSSYVKKNVTMSLWAQSKADCDANILAGTNSPVSNWKCIAYKKTDQLATNSASFVETQSLQNSNQILTAGSVIIPAFNVTSSFNGQSPKSVIYFGYNIILEEI
jgi:hypothetical protein